jgi:hypothetical protein
MKVKTLKLKQAILPMVLSTIPDADWNDEIDSYFLVKPEDLF